MQVPRLEKIVVNIGIGAEAIDNRNAIEAATRDLVAITGQQPVTTLGPQVDCGVQDPRRDAYGPKGDAPRTEDVRVLRSVR